MHDSLRDYFDEHLEAVLAELPRQVTDLLNETPLVVEDYPSREIMRRMGIRHRGDLCGLYTGIPLTQRSIEHSGVLSDVIHLFREGVLNLATDARGRIDEPELRRQIRITILHELGHLHGLDEEELEELGY
jgi:predicted Zn-dependent protease with MMP-like domain